MLTLKFNEFPTGTTLLGQRWM